MTAQILMYPGEPLPTHAGIEGGSGGIPAIQSQPLSLSQLLLKIHEGYVAAHKHYVAVIEGRAVGDSHQAHLAVMDWLYRLGRVTARMPAVWLTEEDIPC